MELSCEDKRMLEEICLQQGINPELVLTLLEIESEFEFREKRTGIYNALREVLSKLADTQEGISS